MFLDIYQKQIAQRNFISDPDQYQAAEQLQQVFDHLTEGSRSKALIRSRLSRLGRKPTNSGPTGLWLWGTVGTGKTYLMDLFFHALPLRKKRRMHFHRFMRHIHEKLKRLNDKRDPLELIAAHMAKKYRVLCIDEFFVSDITDAMILSGLLEGLFKHRITLVATSNAAPEHLYEGGLQRERFLPAIGLLQTCLKVHEMGSSCDYRLQNFDRAELYSLNQNGSSEAVLQNHFQHAASDSVLKSTTIEVEGRTIPVKQLSHDAIWFDFEDLCASPRSVNDYISISRCFNHVMVSDIPVFDSSMEDSARRFIEMIDEFYDHNVKLAVSAAAEPNELYQGQRLQREFERTASRLHEMRTREYFGQAHQIQ